MSNSILKLLFLAGALAASCSFAIAGDTPRLWEIKGKNSHDIEGKFYILAVTHNGLDAEYDDYLVRTVVPIAAKADVFFHEAGGVVPSAYPPCPVPLANTEENRQILRAVRDEVEDAHYNFSGAVNGIPGLSEHDAAEVQEALHTMAHDEAAALSEYGLIAAMESLLGSTLAQHPELWPKWSKRRPQIANYLANQRIARQIKANKSIDADLDIFYAYCNVDGARRGRHLLRLVAENDPAKFKPITEQERARIDAAFDESLRRGSLIGTLTDASANEYSTHLVCDRNDKWMETMRKGLGTGTHFYALGVAHVLQPGPNNSHRCDGLLAKLRHEGFSVTLLK
jgi:hypothetical protein